MLWAQYSVDYGRRMEMMRFAGGEEDLQNEFDCYEPIIVCPKAHLKLVNVILILFLLAQIVDFVVVVMLCR